MAIGKATDFKIKDDFFISSFTETLAQQVDVFNANSNGALQLSSVLRGGDYFKNVFYTTVSSLDTRRDTTSVSAVTPLAMGQEEFISVKMNRKMGPVQHNIDAFRKQKNSPEEMSIILGQQAAVELLASYLTRSLKGLVAALDNVSALKHDATDGTIAYTDMNTGISKLGDRYGDIRACVMHPTPFFNLVGDGISNYKIDKVAGAIIADGGSLNAVMGVPIIVTQDASLVNTDGITTGTDSYYTLLLQEGASMVEESEQQTLHTDVGTLLENLTVIWQFEYAFNLGIRGFKWDTTNGGANPTDATLATGSNWDAAATDDRDKAGAIIESQ